MDELTKKVKNIKLLVIGVDGVLTDAGMYFNEKGDLLRKFNRRDGMGIKLLKAYDIKSAIISSVNSAIVKQWADMFKVDHVRLGCGKKFHEFEKLQIRCGLKFSEIGYISDDIDEIEILEKVGLAVTVADGMEVNKAYSDYVTNLYGGEGAVREVIELLIKSRR